MPGTSPVFVTVKETSYAGRWSQRAVEEPAPFGVGRPFAQVVSVSVSLSVPLVTAMIERSLYENVV